MPDETRDILKQYEDILDESSSIAEALSKINDLQKKQLESAKDLGIEGKLLNSIKEKQISSESQLVFLQDSISDKTREIAKDELQMIDLMSKHDDLWKDIAKKLVESRKEVDELVNKYNSLNNSVQKQISLVDVLNKAGFGKLVDGSKALVELWQHHPMISAAIVLGFIFKKILDTFQEMDNAAAAFRKVVGSTRTGTEEIEKTSRGIAFNFAHVGVSIGEVYEAFSATAKLIGTTQALTKDMATDVSLMSAQFGISAQTSVDFLKTMGMISNSTMASQTNMALFTQRMSEAGGVPLGEVMNDVANASKSSYQFLSRSPLALAKSAVEAKKMGTSLSEATTSAKSLIDFSSSIKSEMEASVLLGESLNLQKARQLSYDKNISGLNKEILRLAEQVNFNQLDPFQQEAVAKAFGKTSDQVAQILQAEKERRAIEKAAAQDPALRSQVERYKSLEKANQSIAKSQAESVREFIKIRANQAAIVSITNSWKAIVQRVAEVFLPIISTVLTGIAFIMGKLNNSAVGFGVAIAAVIGSLVFGVVLVTKLAGLLVGSLGKGLGKGAEGLLGGVASGVEKLGSPGVFKGILAIGLLGVALLPFVGAMKLMHGLDWKSLFVAGSALIFFTAAAFGLGALLDTGAGAILFGSGLIGIAALGIALIPLGIAAMKAGQGLQMLGQGFILIVGGLEKLQNLSFINTVLQVSALSQALKELSQIISNIPQVDIEKIQKLGAISFNSSPTQQTTIEKTTAAGKTLDDVVVALDLMRREFESGAISANVFIDGQKLESTVTRGNKLRGPLGAGVRQ